MVHMISRSHAIQLESFACRSLGNQMAAEERTNAWEFCVEETTHPFVSHYMSQGRSTPCIGDGHPTFNRESL